MARLDLRIIAKSLTDSDRERNVGHCPAIFSRVILARNLARSALTGIYSETESFS